jgi:mono/diheme cytochrome c family protein
MLSFRTKPKAKSKKAKRSVLRPRRAASLFLVFFLFPFSFFLSACRRDMQDQPKTIAYRENSFYKDGSGSRPLVEGTVPRGYLRENREFFTGKKLAAGDLSAEQRYQQTNQSSPGNAANPYPDDVETIPMEITKADIDRGQERYNIYCSVCHGMTGNGDGMVARRGFSKPAPASYHQDRLRVAPVGHFFDVMTNGWGAMPSYASQIPVEDRWRIVAYVRALQLSQGRAPSAGPEAHTTYRSHRTYAAYSFTAAALSQREREHSKR